MNAADEFKIEEASDLERRAKPTNETCCVVGMLILAVERNEETRVAG